MWATQKPLADGSRKLLIIGKADKKYTVVTISPVNIDDSGNGVNVSTTVKLPTVDAADTAPYTKTCYTNVDGLSIGGNGHTYTTMMINGKSTLVDFTKDVVQSTILDSQGNLITTKLAANPNTYIYDCGVATIRKGYTDVTFIIGGASVDRTELISNMSKSIYICYNPESTNTLKIIKLS